MPHRRIVRLLVLILYVILAFDSSNFIYAASVMPSKKTPVRLILLFLVLAAVIIVWAGGEMWLRTIQPLSLPSYRTAQPAAQPPALVEREAIAPPPVDWQRVDAEIVTALLQAKSAAETTAVEGLDAWISVLMQRVDRDFLEWYFNYWTQQELGVKGAWGWTLDQVIGREANWDEHLTEEIQEEFAWRVLRSGEAQLELTQIAESALDVYARHLQHQLAGIPQQHRIPQPEWEGYLQDIAVLTATSEGNRRVSLSLKAITAGSVGGGAVLAAALAAPMQSLGGKTSTKLAAKAAGQMAGKTGAKVASRTGGRMLGLIIGIGIVFWEAWDHEQTVVIERPKLRQTIVDYFAEMKKSLLYDPGAGIIAMLDTMEKNMMASLRTRTRTIATGKSAR